MALLQHQPPAKSPTAKSAVLPPIAKNSLTEADFLNNEILIHRQTTANCMTDYGQVLYRQDGLIEKVSTCNIEPLHAELAFCPLCQSGNQPSVGGEQALKAPATGKFN